MDYDNWIQDVMYHMIMAKLNESEGINHKSGKKLIRVMRENDIDFRCMHECGIEAYEVPDEIREPGSMFLTPR